MGEQLKVEEIRAKIDEGAPEEELQELLDAERALPKDEQRKTAIAALEERLAAIEEGRALRTKRFHGDAGEVFGATDGPSSTKVEITFDEDGVFATDDEAAIRVLMAAGYRPEEG
jgi:DNA-binding transcriptional MerR regulator